MIGATSMEQDEITTVQGQDRPFLRNCELQDLLIQNRKSRQSCVSGRLHVMAEPSSDSTTGTGKFSSA
jgi:hypothetical protein